MPKPGRPESLRRRSPHGVASVVRVVALVGAGIFVLNMGAARAQVKLLPPEEAFRFSARALDPRSVEASFAIADGYYLYRDKLRFTTTTVGAAIGSATLPPGMVKEDPFFGRVETYRDRVAVRLPIDGATAGQQVAIRAESQGCADAGVCYPPNAQVVTVTLPPAGAPPGPVIDATPPRKRWFN